MTDGEDPPIRCDYCGQASSQLQRQSWYIGGEFVQEWWCPDCVRDELELRGGHPYADDDDD